MRIALVTPYYAPEYKFGGPPQKIHGLAKRLRHGGHCVKVVTFNHNDREAANSEYIEGIAVSYVPWRGAGLRQFPKNHRVLRKEIGSCDVVHCYGLYTALVPIAVRIARRCGVPVVQEPLGMYPPRARNRMIKGVYNQLITRRMLNNSAAVIATSHREKMELEAFVPDAPIYYRRNGIDVQSFADLPSPDGLRSSWGIRADEQVVLFVGRLSPIKNLEQLMIAFAELEELPLRLVLVGPSEPDYEERLRHLAQRSGVHDRLVFAGPLYEEEQKAALAAADLFVLPSISESFGNAAAEAVAAGVPVLLTNTCGTAPMIHGRAGMAVPLGVKSLAEGVRQMLDPEIRDQMTAQREEVKRELSWDEPVSEMIRIYERVISEKAERLKS